MGSFVAEKTIKKLIESDVKIKGANVLVMGLTFKENVPDLRNSKIVDVINELKDYGVNIIVTDPVAKKEDAQREYGLKVYDISDIKDIDAVILAVNHQEYAKLSLSDLKSLCRTSGEKPVLIDIKGLIDKTSAKADFNYWRL